MKESTYERLELMRALLAAHRVRVKEVQRLALLDAHAGPTPEARRPGPGRTAECAPHRSAWVSERAPVLSASAGVPLPAPRAVQVQGREILRGAL